MSTLIPKNWIDLDRFLEEWYGTPNASPCVPIEDQIAPRKLVEWHRISSKWNGQITPQNYAIPLERLQKNGGLIEFWAESQGNWSWAFDPNGDGHAVYDQDATGKPTPWRETGETLEEFLIHATVLEAVFGAPEATTATNVPLEWILTHGECALFYQEWRWPAQGSRIVAGGRWIGLVSPVREGSVEYDITLGARHAEQLTWVLEAPGIDWQSYSASENTTDDEPLPW
ncbi:hypothetical protein [Embleya sp. NPDC050493]|uniref:hypothetical protein n=1 Tax=Embleya sp. NPDC050493 TaxID=3363989 RepID=UPI0037A8E186